MRRFSPSRWWAVVRKEFIQLRRDRITFAMVVGIPVVQLLLFGYAINTEPRHLPTAVVVAEPSEFSRSFLAAMRNSGYFEIVEELDSEAAARAALQRGRVKFLLTVPADFSRRLLRGERPALLIEADATDPAAAGAALASVRELGTAVAKKDLQGALAPLAGAAAPPFELRVHRLYNPEGLTQHNIVPGLMGVILAMTMVMMTGLAMTRERERGTMENMLAMPLRPLEVMTGKLVPYVLIGLVQASIILLAARWLFDVPFLGSVPLLYAVALIYISANLTVGITLSSLARNQLQAMQLTFFYFLPSILLSGFMFPFEGMPRWAQAIGSAIPATYFMRAVRGILLKGNGWVDVWPHVWPMLLFATLVMGIALRFYRRTLD
ncbi:ABC transporter permease [Roseateles violae]|uniref:ABC transporter permease n=1 Tax=Roseateles violae TaxID=3058042 RepID=A0ABT8DMB0_9BURK|nr:ABC transporter permease [Pelomonas sp. PFR6]MDN3919539.1 ABC transporter permease [Pelomonas sp. PFR6]